MESSRKFWESRRERDKGWRKIQRKREEKNERGQRKEEHLRKRKRKGGKLWGGSG